MIDQNDIKNKHTILSAGQGIPFNDNESKYKYECTVYYTNRSNTESSRP